MSRTAPTRDQLVGAIIAQGRANSTGTVLLHAAIAERLGLNPSDHKCADLMMSESEACTPGRLAELTGLSTGAITGVIDRLERAGFLVREHDPEDRRRVLLRLTQTRSPELHALFAPLSRGVEALCENYSIAELAVVLRYMREVRVVTDELAQRLRSVGPVLAPKLPATAAPNVPVRPGSNASARKTMALGRRSVASAAKTAGPKHESPRSAKQSFVSPALGSGSQSPAQGRSARKPVRSKRDKAKAATKSAAAGVLGAKRARSRRRGSDPRADPTT